MQGLGLFAGNLLENLAIKLTENLQEPLSSPFEKEIIVVQSKGMENWLSMQLAERNGICSNCIFPFPSNMMDHLFRLVLPEVPEESLFGRALMSWRIMSLLPGLVENAGFESIRSYLRDDPKGMKLYQLSDCLADIYDSYVVFRPEMIMGWQQGSRAMPESAGRLEAWQSQLWKALAQDHGHEHMAALRERFISALNASSTRILPERISLFGISYLPPFYLEVFYALSFFIPVNFYLMNPCRQYWGDIRSRSEIARMTILYREAARELYLEEGNSLLAAMGSVGRDLFDILQDYEPREIDAFVDVSSETLLGRIQADILDLVAPKPDDAAPISPLDNSIQIHSCHSPMREIEVLKDNLLALFDEDPELRPEDIVVMSPEIEKFMPFIQSVFDVPKNSRAYIPFSVVDRSLKTSGALADVVLAILDLSLSRFEASKVLSLLESEPLRKRFGFREQDLEVISRWVWESGIRWGLDADWKLARGLPDFRENTWDFGLDRLLLGYAMTSDGRLGFKSILPYDDIEGDGSQVLGSFLTFLTSLFTLIRKMQEPHSLKWWSEELMGLLDRFFAVDESAVPQARAIRSVFTHLSGIFHHARFDGDVSLEVMRVYLKQKFGAIEEGRNFLSGGVTFCAMLPMRSIPFKVVCILGMNHNDFPRQQRAKGFDLVAHLPRKGDCHLRNKDLYLFLEALLSARKVFYVSYTGQNMQDNSSIPPCVPVSTLLDYLESGYRTEDGRPVREAVVRKHCLQAFNPRYFTGSEGLFSFSAENAEAAARLVSCEKQERTFISRRLTEPGDEWKTIDIAMLCEFFRNPSKFMLKRRLSMAFSGSISAPDDIEPVELTELELYQLRREHITHLLEGMDCDSSFELIRMGGYLPHGTPGDIAFCRIREESDSFVRTVINCISNAEPLTRLIDLQLGSFTLTGSLRTYGPDRIILCRPANVKPAYLFTAWIHHLVLCALSKGPECRSYYISRDETVEFAAVKNSMDILGTILDLFREGMARPLPFFPETSWKYAALSTGKGGSMPKEERLQKARHVWEGDRYSRNESEDFSYRICFKGRDPLDAEFEQLSLRLFGPLIEHRKSSPS